MVAFGSSLYRKINEFASLMAKIEEDPHIPSTQKIEAMKHSVQEFCLDPNNKEFSDYYHVWDKTFIKTLVSDEVSSEQELRLELTLWMINLRVEVSEGLERFLKEIILKELIKLQIQLQNNLYGFPSSSQDLLIKNIHDIEFKSINWCYETLLQLSQEAIEIAMISTSSLNIALTQTQRISELPDHKYFLERTPATLKRRLLIKIDELRIKLKNKFLDLADINKNRNVRIDPLGLTVGELQDELVTTLNIFFKKGLTENSFFSFERKSRELIKQLNEISDELLDFSQEIRQNNKENIPNFDTEDTPGTIDTDYISIMTLRDALATDSLKATLTECDQLLAVGDTWTELATHMNALIPKNKHTSTNASVRLSQGSSSSSSSSSSTDLDNSLLRNNDPKN